MAEERVRMPTSFGGLVRYFDEYKSRLQLKPAHVVLIIILFIIFEVIVRL